MTAPSISETPVVAPVPPGSAPRPTAAARRSDDFRQLLGDTAGVPLPARKPAAAGPMAATGYGGFIDTLFTSGEAAASRESSATSTTTLPSPSVVTEARVELEAVARPGRKPLPPATLSQRDYAEVVRMTARVAQIRPEELMARMAQESNFRLDARARTSSAAGPFQFIEGTWLTMLRRYGAAYGLGPEVEQIQMRDGKPTVRDPALRKRLLDLRHDLNISSGMAARYLSEAGETLGRLLQRPASGDERRLAFMLGPGGASRLIKAAQHDPHGSAAALLPSAARANHSLFYAENQPLSNREAHARFIRMLGRGLDSFAFREEQPPTVTDAFDDQAGVG